MSLFENASFLSKEALASDRDHELENELAEKFKKGDVTAYKQLRRMYQPDINRAAQLAQPKDRGVSLAQIKMRAEWAFPHAVMRYDPAEAPGGNLHGWVMFNVRKHMQNLVGEEVTGPYVGRENQSKRERITKAVRAAEMEYGPDPTDEQILKHLPGPKTLENLEEHKKFRFTTTIGDITTGQDGEDTPLLFRDQFTGVDTARNPDEHFHTMELERIKDIMRRTLDPVEFEVVKRRAIDNVSMAQVALEVGISTTKLRSIMAKWDEIKKREGLV